MFKVTDTNLIYALLLLLQFMLEGKEELRFINSLEMILMMLLRKFSISDVENSRAKVSISNNDLQKALKRIVNKKTNKM